MNEIPCYIYRGGTSRGVFFLEKDLPESREERERILLRVLGSPDVRQIDGIGGANSQTSKAMIVGPAEASADVAGVDSDVAMWLAEVSIDQPVVDWGGNCGNLTSAVGAFAIDAGLVEPKEPETVVRIVSRNTGVRVHAHIPVRDGRLAREGDYQIPGVPGTAARIDCEWLEPGSSQGRGLLPTGNTKDILTTDDGERYEVSILDAANPVVFVEARAVGLEGTELPTEIEARPNVIAKLEQIRGVAAARSGIPFSPGFPKVAVVAAPLDYEPSRWHRQEASTHDVQARMISMRTAHRSYAVTVGICTATAASIPGTIVPPAMGEDVRIAHPYGVMDVRVKMDGHRVVSARVGRTARLIMSGVAHLG